MTVSAASASAINGSYFLQSLTSKGNWLLDAASSDPTDWMDPTDSGPDLVDSAATAFAQAESATTAARGSIAVNQGINVLQSQLAGLGESVDIFA